MPASRLIALLLLVLTISLPALAQDQTRKPASEATQDQGPSYDDTVKWIQDHIQEAGIPGWTDPGKLSTTVYDDETYGIKFDGCNTIHLLFNTHNHTTDNDPNDNGDLNADTSVAYDVKVPFAKINRATPFQNGAAPGVFSNFLDELTSMQTTFLELRAQGNRVMVPAKLIDEQHQLKTQLPAYPSVAILLNEDAGTVSSVTKTMTDTNTVRDFPLKKQYFFATDPMGAHWKAVMISFGMAGTDDSPVHMAKAFNHLMDLCKANPDAAPKDLF